MGQQERHSLPGHAACQEHCRVRHAGCIRCGTCDICPTGARYSPDFTFKKLLAQKKITVLDDSTAKILSAQGIHSERPQETADYRAKLFVVASGYTWSSHLLLN